MQYAKARDKNEGAIIDALLEVGAHVTQLGDFGVPDLLVGYKGRTFLLEVKGELGPKGGGSGRGLTPQQELWWNGGKTLRKESKPLPPWAEVGGPANIVRTPEEALAAIGAHAGPVQEVPAWWLCRVKTLGPDGFAHARIPADRAKVGRLVYLSFGGDPSVPDSEWLIDEIIRPSDPPGIVGWRVVGWRDESPKPALHREGDPAISLAKPDQSATRCSTCESGDRVMSLRLPWPGGHDHATAVNLCRACRATAAAVLVSL